MNRKHNKLGTILVGDLHGDWGAAEAAINSPYNVVFVGDYVDSFTFSKEDQIKTINMVLDAAIKEPERVTALQGNHEHSYFDDYTICSGWNTIMNSYMAGIEEVFRDNTYLYTWVDGFLVTHAGLTQAMLKTLEERVGYVIDTRLKLEDILLDEETQRWLASFIGRYRGGFAPAGGITWCDWWAEFEPLDFVKQVVGHSAARPGNLTLTKGVVEEEGNFNIDCLQTSEEILHIKDGIASVMTLEDLS